MAVKRHPLVPGPEFVAICHDHHRTHDPYLVALSILVACFASFTALDLGGGRFGATRGPTAGVGRLGSRAVDRREQRDLLEIVEDRYDAGGS
jgi:hypothetical protein